MACGCGGKKARRAPPPYDVMGGYKYLSQQQINKRLEVFKRVYCKTCQGRYSCDFNTYQTCEVRPKNESTA